MDRDEAMACAGSVWPGPLLTGNKLAIPHSHETKHLSAQPNHCFRVGGGSEKHHVDLKTQPSSACWHSNCTSFPVSSPQSNMEFSSCPCAGVICLPDLVQEEQLLVYGISFTRDVVPPGVQGRK